MYYNLVITKLQDIFKSVSSQICVCGVWGVCWVCCVFGVFGVYWVCCACCVGWVYCVCWVWGIYAICFMGFRLPRPPRLVRLRPSTSLGTGSPQVARGPRNDNGVLSVCGVCCVCGVCHLLRFFGRCAPSE
jgi:hypothetical protein